MFDVLLATHRRRRRRRRRRPFHRNFFQNETVLVFSLVFLSLRVSFFLFLLVDFNFDLPLASTRVEWEDPL